MSKKIEDIGREVEKEYQMDGLSTGLYMDFAKEVALRFLTFQIRVARNKWNGGKYYPKGGEYVNGWADCLEYLKRMGRQFRD